MAAFSVLLKEKNYAGITVNDIVGRAGVGRSTFYRHFNAKADCLILSHAHIFNGLTRELSTPEAWLSPEPPKALAGFLASHQSRAGQSYSMVYKLGPDIDYVMEGVNRLLAATMKSCLDTAFGDRLEQVPLDVLAASVAATYSGLIMAWFRRIFPHDAAATSGYIHALCSAQVRAGLAGDPPL